MSPSPAGPLLHGDGLTDDTDGLNAALHSLANGTFQLDCRKSYYFAGRIDIVGVNVTLRHCADVPAVIYGEPKIDIPISILEGPHITLGPRATFNLARGSGIENAIVFASSIRSMKLPDARAFAGTALTQASGGLGTGIHARNLVLLGFSKCYDGGSGGAAIDFRDILCDGVDGFLFGTSQGTSHLDALAAAPYLTAAFEGYRIASVRGAGSTLTFGYTGPVMKPGRYVNFLGAAISGLTNNVPAKIIGATGSALPTSASTVTIANAAPSGPAAGFLQDYDTQYLRGAYGFRFVDRSDDTHFGSLVDFGHDVSLDVASAAFLSGEHLWCDNNRVACVRNAGHQDLQIGDVTATTVEAAYKSSPGAQPVSTSIGRLFARFTFSDCVSVGAGSLFVGNLDCGQVGKRSEGYGIRISDPKAFVMVPSGEFSQLTRGGVMSAAPQDHLSINVKWIDAAPGASLFAAPVPKLPGIEAETLIRLPPNYDKLVVTGARAITSIEGGRDGREIVLECADACTITSHGGRPGLGVAPRGSRDISGPGVFRFWYSGAKSMWLQE